MISSGAIAANVTAMIDQNVLWIKIQHLAEHRSRGFLVVDFAGHGVDRIDVNGHGQGMAEAIVDIAAAGFDGYSAGALPLGEVFEEPELHHLQANQAKTDSENPDE